MALLHVVREDNGAIAIERGLIAAPVAVVLLVAVTNLGLRRSDNLQKLESGVGSWSSRSQDPRDGLGLRGRVYLLEVKRPSPRRCAPHRGHVRPMSAQRVVAFQGMLGAFSHLACRATHPEWEVLPCPTFDAVFDAVESGRAARAVIPVENSQAGRVTDIHRLLPQRTLFIVGEHYQPIHHQLVGVPGARIEDVLRVRSHPQALAQCRDYLTGKGFEAVAARDTAEAAVEVGLLGDPSTAAIASRVAAEIHGLTILDHDIEDAHDNTTRFLVMSPAPVAFDRSAGRLVTSCLFRVRNIPAALYKALGGFATNGVNLLKLESYQLGGFQWAQFVVDLEGHPDDPPVARALEELRYFATELRLLGTFPAAPRPELP